MKVKEIMHKGVEWVSPDTPLTKLATRMLKHDVGAIPIGENDRLVGMVLIATLPSGAWPMAKISPTSRPEMS